MRLLDKAAVAVRQISAWATAIQIRRGGAFETGLLVLLGCGISLRLGTDDNWDLRNYHLLNAYSLWHGRFQLDLVPVGIHSYLSPLLDLPYYLLSIELIPGMPRLVAFLAGIPFGLLVVVVLRIARITLPATGVGSPCLPPIATAIGVTGTVTWSEIGTTCGDIPVAVLALCGLLCGLRLLPHRETMSGAAWTCAMGVAGLLMGAAAGFKLTACIFAPGALLGLSLASGSVRHACLGAVAFCAGWAAGLAVVDGWWLLMLYRRFGNPVFPMLNRLFASPWIPADNFNDLRFQPRTLGETLFYPFFWLRGRPSVVAELAVRDPRFALTYIAVVGIAIVELARAAAAWRSGARRQRLPPVTTALGIFVVVAYVAWQVQFSILRYAIGIEAVTGIIIVLGLRRLLGTGRQSTLFASAGMLTAVVLVSTPFSWGRLGQYGAKVLEIEPVTLPDGATVILADKPIGFIVPFLSGHRLSFVGIVDVAASGRLRDEVRQRVHDAAPALVLIDGPAKSYAALLAPYGRQIDPLACAPVRNPRDHELALCVAVQTR